MQKKRRHLFVLIHVLFLPSLLFAQHETGTYTQHDANGAITHEVGNVPIINAEYGGKGPERPEPGRSGGGGNSHGGTHTSPAGNSQVERTATVTINGASFKVSKDAEKRLKEFLETYKENGKVGEFVSVVASVFSLFDLFNLDKSFPKIDATFKLATFDPEQVLIKLSSPSIWNRAWRAQAVSFCEAELSLALARGKSKDAQMWLRVRDIIANPEKYKDGGIKYNHTEKKILLRSYPAEAYRSIAGFDMALKDLDINQLGYLTNYLMYFPQSRDYIIYADYIYDLRKSSKDFKKITERDKMILNFALLGLPEDAKNYLDKAFSTNSLNPNQTFSFWQSLKKYLYEEKWSNGIPPDYSVDQLGFATDEYFNNSDLVFGEYPATSLFAQPLPTNWNIPPKQRHLIYEFYYKGK